MKTSVPEGLLNEGESLYGTANLSLLHHVSAALKAHCLFNRDVEYIVADGEIVIVDEHGSNHARSSLVRRDSPGH